MVRSAKRLALFGTVDAQVMIRRLVLRDQIGVNDFGLPRGFFELGQSSDITAARL